LTGVSEHRAFQAYNAQLALAVRQLAVFYSAKYRWSETESQRMAEQALKAAISKGFGFYMYAPFTQQAHRDFVRAVLDRRPMTEIKNFPLSLASIQSVELESLFNAAVTYPDALRYLLASGADPNMANAFGKTPLMYAAQYDVLEAVQILLDHQADPNATTTLATDNCYYTLQTSHMTPLHYAVRYGSARTIQALIDRGAVTFFRTQRTVGDPGEYAIDWLHKYAAENALERNPNLSRGDVEKLEALLRVPDNEELGRISVRLTQFGESEYAAGRTQSAYRALRTALSAQEDNQKALEDFSLVALRAGQIGASLEAAEKIIAASVSRSSVASAWFNQGLACEKGGKFVGYNGEYYCRLSRPYPFLTSWRVEPTAARKSKLIKLFTEELPTCFVPQENWQVYFEWAQSESDRTYSPRQLIYIHHPTSQKLDPNSVHWTVTVVIGDGPNKQQTLANRYLSLVAAYDLGPSTISVLASKEPVQWPISLGKGRCDSVPMK
jgi:tetratricopeptide (TPR) repeat protein